MFIRVVFLLFMMVELSAVAGGGGGFGGGGGGGGGGGFSGGGGYSGGGGGGPNGPIDIVIIIFFIIVIILFSLFGEKQVRSFKSNRRRKLVSLRQHRKNIDRMIDTDDNFDFDIFEARLKSAFAQIQAAWCAQDIRSIRAYVSDGIYERFNIQIQEQKDNGIRDRVEILHWNKPKLIDVHQDGQNQVITVLVSAIIKDFRINEHGKNMSGNTGSKNYSECWVLVRRSGVLSIDGEGLIEGNCPNCAAALKMRMHTQCEYCQAILRSGEYDWVLSEITQTHVWAPRRSNIPGHSLMLRKDPEFCIQHMEDQCSVAFFRYMEAERVRHTKSLEFMASQKLIDYRQALIRETNSVYKYYADCSMGFVEIFGILHGNGEDICVIETRWNAMQFRETPNGESRPTFRISPRSSYYIFTRPANVISKREHLLSSTHCRSCGAPQTNLLSKMCDSCASPFLDKSKDWLLTGVCSFHHEKMVEIRRLLDQQMEQEPSRELGEVEPSTVAYSEWGIARRAEECLTWVIKALLADSSSDEKELNVVRSFAKKYGINAQQISDLIRDIKSEAYDLPIPETTKEMRVWMDHMILIAVADGVLTKAERRILTKVGEKYGLHDYDVTLRVRALKSKWQDDKIPLA